MNNYLKTMIVTEPSAPFYFHPAPQPPARCTGPQPSGCSSTEINGGIRKSQNPSHLSRFCSLKAALLLTLAGVFGLAPLAPAPASARGTNKVEFLDLSGGPAHVRASAPTTNNFIPQPLSLADAVHPRAVDAAPLNE